MLYNVADMDKATVSEDRDTAAILEGSQLCCSCQLRDMVHCLGGMAILLPLVRALLACGAGCCWILCCWRGMVRCLWGMAILLPLGHTLLAASVGQLLQQSTGMWSGL